MTDNYRITNLFLVLIFFFLYLGIIQTNSKIDRIEAAQEYRLCTQYGDAYQKWAKEKNVEVCKGF